MSTADQLLYSALHGTAMRYTAEERNLAESIAAFATRRVPSRSLYSQMARRVASFL
jgi:hypothetical protein